MKKPIPPPIIPTQAAIFSVFDNSDKNPGR